jgi:transmembrane sensor
VSLPAFGDTWTPERAALVGQRVQRQLVQRRRAVRVAAVALAVAAVAAAGAALMPREAARTAASPHPAAPAPAREVALHAGVDEGHVVLSSAAERTGSGSLVEQTAAQAPDWRPLANRGEFDAAWPLVRSVRDDARDLLLASDVARLSGHPREARRWLEQLLARHPRDERAPLAAFTLGRVLLEELGWPKDAASAFARTRALQPDGPLAEDALAREVEAWSRAGETDRARAAAELYLQKYPRGQRAAGVRRHGGL